MEFGRRSPVHVPGRVAARRWRGLSAAPAFFLVILLVAAAAPAGADGTVAPACRDRLYTANSFSDNVSVVDTSSNEVVATVGVGKAPGWAVLSPDGTQLYVSNSQGSSISVIDVATNAVVRTIPTAAGPIGLAFTPDGTRLVVTYLQGTVSVMTLATGESTAPAKVGVDPEQIRITPDGRYAYLASTLQGVYKVDLNTLRTVATIPVKDFHGGAVPLPYNLIISADGGTVYVAATLGGLIAAIDTRSDAIVKSWPAKGPVGLQLSPDQKRLYVTNFWGASLDEYDVATGSQLRTSGQTDISLPSHLAESADGRYLYFGQSFGPKLEVFDASTWKPVKTLTVGTGPNALALCDPASSH